METSQGLSSLEFLRKFHLSTLCLGDYVTIGSNQPTNYPFWNEKTVINARKFVRFLEDLGFGQYQASPGRTSGKDFIRRVDNVIQLHSPMSMRRVVSEHIENDDDLDPDSKDNVLDKLARKTASQLTTICNDLTVWSQQGYDGTKTLKIMSDTATQCFIPFENGVVVISKDVKDAPTHIPHAQLHSYEVLGDNCVWETSIRKHKITPTSPDGTGIRYTDKGLFAEFAKFALRSDVDPDIDAHKPYQYKHLDHRLVDFANNKYRQTWDAFTTAYGYLIHNYNPSDGLKMVVFVDMDSSDKKAEGRNGKSLTMKTLERFKQTAFIDGKLFRKSLNESSRFNFSNVTVDTRLVIINDLNPDLDMTQLFSHIADDFTIEDKGKSKIIIPQDKKPKMCCNTNYVITGSGPSYDGRQHIVEFGNYWNKCEKLGIKPKDILGKKLCDEDFTQEDWDEFYQFGFYCVWKYLNNGLMEAENSDYKRKNLIQTVEGEQGTGELTEWLEEWCKTTRKDWDYHINGISEADLLQAFRDDRPDLTNEWDASNFFSAVFDFATTADGYDYNPHKASAGNTKTKRRWRQGSSGQQENWVKITHRDD